MAGCLQHDSNHSNSISEGNFVIFDSSWLFVEAETGKSKCFCASATHPGGV
jgi:uncharacterized protein YchJ